MLEKRSVPALKPDELLGLKEMAVMSDVMGSYTGRPLDAEEKPIQDADDL